MTAGCGLGSCDLRYRPLVGFCEHGAEPAGSKSAGNFLLQNSDSNTYSIDCIGLDLFNFCKFLDKT